MSITGVVRYMHDLGVTISVRAGEQLVSFADQTFGPFKAFDLEDTVRAMRETGEPALLLAAHDWIKINTEDTDKTTRLPWQWVHNNKKVAGSPADEVSENLVEEDRDD